MCEGVSKVQIQRPKVLILIEDLPRHRKWKHSKAPGPSSAFVVLLNLSQKPS